MIEQLLAPRYLIEREIGQGGMAVVYLAHERKHGRQVAVKVMRLEVSATLGADRFLREIGIAARLSHPHLVPLIDSGVVEGHLYYVSAFVSGGSLRDRLDREYTLSVPDALRVAREVGSALDYMHRAGFVHRDIKPENILFADGHAMLADFGLAISTDQRDNAVTQPGIVIGTPPYMSPEQASGEIACGPPSDVYSLACVVYQMLAGRPPLLGLSARATIMRQISAIPPRLRIVCPEIPQVVDDTIARALRKSPDHRFHSIAEFNRHLNPHPAPVEDLRSSRASRATGV